MGVVQSPIQPERAIDQVTGDHLFALLDDEANSIAVIMKHTAGNMRSRWTDFVTTDGEKPDRYRDTEFTDPPTTREALLKVWADGWQRVFTALEPLTDADLARTIAIRGEAHSVMQAINRQLAHYACHVGQIVLLAKHFQGANWKSLSIPKGMSAAFNQNVTAGKASQANSDILLAEGISMRILAPWFCCFGIMFGQAGPPLTNPPDPNPRAATDHYIPRVPRTLVTTVHMVLDDGGPPSRTPGIQSSSCASSSIRPDGVATLVSYNGSGGCSASISLPGFQTTRLETAEVHRPITVVMQRYAADAEEPAAAPMSASMQRIPPPAHKAYGEGEIAIGLGHSEEAAGWFRKAVTEYPRYTFAWDELGLALQSLNRTSDAKTAWEKALAVDPAFARSWTHLAGLALSEQHPADAAELTARALKLPGPLSARTCFYDAVANYTLGRSLRAESSARQTIRLDQAHLFPRAEFILGMALAQGSDSSAATTHLQSYLALEPQGEFATAARQRLTELDSRARR